jgi:hypothetical protein
MDHVLFQSMNIPPPPPPLPAINTNVLETLPILDNTNDEMPPLSKDNIYTPTTFMQPTPTDLAYQSYSSTINHHPGVYPISTTATSTSSLTSYQEFTPSPSVDYFCQDLFTNDDAKNNISYPQPLSFRKSRKRGFEHVESPDSQPYLLTYTTNPSHLTLLNGKRVHL